jgi:hypothetical protein
MSENTYHISGDGTGLTYGVYKGDITKSMLIKSGFKSFKECQKFIEEELKKKK